jgi:hypothetical protein
MNRWLIALSFVTVTAQAQTGAAGTIDPGMTRAQVIERLGKPATVRTYQGSTYLLYSNNCGKTCGMQDLVILDHDVVVDAVFRSPNRHYTGTSSSPDATKPNERAQRSQPLRVPSSAAAPDSNGPTTTLPTLQGNGATTSVPADSALTSTSHPLADSAKTSTSRPPADSASMRSAPPAAGPVPYGKPPTTPPPGDSAKTSTSHPPVDNATSSTSHPPKPPQ